MHCSHGCKRLQKTYDQQNYRHEQQVGNHEQQPNGQRSDRREYQAPAEARAFMQQQDKAGGHGRDEKQRFAIIRRNGCERLIQ